MSSSISFQNLTKRYGPVLAVDGLSFDVEPGRVTGFLGPNGSGKTTTLRILLGLATPTAGTATIGGLAYHQLPDPVRQIGAALDSNTFHPGRSAAQHLRVIATATGLPRRRVDEVLGLVGLADVAGRRVGGFSLGMRQRLSLAGALLGDPGVLVFDEPLNGLDPDGIRWLRGLLRELAGENRTVFVSSHLLSEVAQTVDDVVVLSRGRLRAQTTLADLVARTSVVRARVFAVKVAVIAVLGAVFGALVFGLGDITILLTLAAHGIHHLPAGVGQLYLGTVIASDCFGMIGVALGTLTRNTIGAIVAAIAWALFIEQVILNAIMPGVEKWLPTAAAIGLTNAPGPDPSRSLSPTIAGLVLAGYAVALLVAASRTTMRRDVT